MLRSCLSGRFAFLEGRDQNLHGTDLQSPMGNSLWAAEPGNGKGYGYMTKEKEKSKCVGRREYGRNMVKCRNWGPTLRMVSARQLKAN